VKSMRIKAVMASLMVTGTALAAFPATVHASTVGGTGTAITIDKMSGRSVTGGGNFVVTASTSPTMPEMTASQSTSASLDVEKTASNALVIEFECHAVASRDATQTRIVPGGCTLYKGGIAVGYAPGQSLPGPTAATRGAATVSLFVPGELVLCWDVSATYLLNGGAQLYNSDCTS
jgi:hypothetical protein